MRARGSHRASIPFIRCQVTPVLLAAAPQRSEPVPGHLVAEGLDCRDVAGHGVVCRVPAQHAGQPAALLRDRIVHAAPELDLDLGQLSPQPLGDRDALQREPPAPVHPASMGEAREIERLRPAPALGRPVPDGEPPELDQPGLIRVQFQAELRQPGPKLSKKPPRVLLVLKTDDKVVGLCRGPGYADLACVVAGQGGGGVAGVGIILRGCWWSACLVRVSGSSRRGDDHGDGL